MLLLPEQLAVRADINERNLANRIHYRVNQKHIAFEVTFMATLILAGEQMVLILKRRWCPLSKELKE